MNTVLTLIIFAVCSLYIWRMCEAAYATNTNTRMRFKIVAMERELVMDAMVKRANINWIKKYYKSSFFNVGESVCGIRKKYVRMIHVYMRTLEHFDDFDFGTTIEEFEDKDTRKKRITRTGTANASPMQEQLRQADTLKAQRQKQKEYIEKKKMLYSLAHGSPRQGLDKHHFQKRNKMEEGFNTDMYNLYN